MSFSNPLISFLIIISLSLFIYIIKLYNYDISLKIFKNYITITIKITKFFIFHGQYLYITNSKLH